MNSKEALEKLNFECIRSNGIDDEYSKELNIVEKDLKVLDIIKEHKLLNYVLKNKKCANMYHLSKKECDLLKEWYDNGKIN